MSFSVLVLNANFEPIHVCDLHRALGLIQAEKASLVLNGRGEIHSISRVFPIPSVIRLEKMVSHPRQHITLNRREVFRRDNYTCQYCGRRTPTLTIDHIIPRRLGGKHEWTNVTTACPSCNHRKGGRALEETNMHLLHKAVEPPQSAEYRFNHHIAEFAEWEPFITGW
jgi:5-methylcytosine-specific restriction endonuclease McrA